MGDSGKTAIINKELARLNIDVACLQETRLADTHSGSLMERGYTFFWQGLSQDEPMQYGVGFAVRNSLIATTEIPSGGSSRILALCMKTSAGFVNFISAYVPTLTSTPEAKYQFYEALQETPGGGTPRNSWWGCAARVFKSRPYFRPKHAIFHTRFQT